jgi:hypothetical protein
LDAHNHQRLIVEVTERVDGIIMDWWAKHRTLRGAWIKFARMGESASSRIHCTIRDEVCQGVKPVTEQELREILCHVWKMPISAANLLETHPHKIALENGPSNVTGDEGDLRLLG